MTFTAEQNNELTPGTWKRGKIGPRRLALFACPKCGLICSLSDHTIESTGRVNPSVVCPREGCSFHEWVALANWSPA